MFTERKAIQFRMEQIKEERRALNDEYYVLVERLRELDTHEKETYDIESILGTLAITADRLSRLIPNVPIERVVQEFESQNSSIINEEKEIMEIEEKKQDFEIKLEVEKQKEKDSIISTSKNMDLKKASSIVLNILKDRGTPVKASTLQSILEEDYGYKWRNFTTAINQIMDYNNKITRASRGYYQVKY